MEIFDYDNVLLLPRKCRVESRSECDASTQFGARSFKLPVVPANMKTVIYEPISEWLAANDYFYVMHRFDLDNVAEGVGADYITIDIAHGHAESVRKTIEHIKARLPATFQWGMACVSA